MTQYVYLIITKILILYDYRYYCDFKIVFNLFIQYITGCVRIRYPCPNTDILYCYTDNYIPSDTLCITR